MTQVRYRDWKSVVGSKDSMEPFALISGLGVQFGLDEVTTMDTSKLASDNLISITIGTTLSNIQGLRVQNNKVRYVSNKLNVAGTYHGALITPDGILTTFNSPVTITNIDVTGANTDSEGYIEIQVTARHLYAESETNIIETTISGKVVKQSGRSITATLSDQGANINTWLANSHNSPDGGNLDVSSEVIIGLLRIKKATPTIYSYVVPYNYEWPVKHTISQSMWSSLLVRVTELEEALGDQSIHAVQPRALMDFDVADLSEFPQGYIPCGKWYVGYGTDSSIVKPTGDTTTLAEVNTWLANNMNSKFAITTGAGTQSSLILSKTSSTGGDSKYWYYIDFPSKKVNGYPIPDFSGKFKIGGGYMSNYPLGGVFVGAGAYKPGDIGGEAFHQLAMAEMPKHGHKYYDLFSSSGSTYTYSNSDQDDGSTRQEYDTSEVGGDVNGVTVPHENRPPYYVVATFKKVI